MSDLDDEVRRVIEELDPDGGGYRTKEAADLLHLRAMEGCVVTPIAEQLMRIGAGEAEEGQEPENPAAVLGRKGGAARARNLTPEQRREIAKKGAASRWNKPE
jgi:hypothetical protein